MTSHERHIVRDELVSVYKDIRQSNKKDDILKIVREHIDDVDRPTVERHEFAD